MTDSRPTEWLVDLRGGDSDAARKIFSHFSQKLCRLAERHLSNRVRRQVDGEDVVQSVFRTFFVRDAQGQFEVDHTDELWRLLVTITLRKARGVWRKNASQSRSVDREIEMLRNDELDALGIFSREPSIVDAIVLADEVESLLCGLTASHAKALELRLGGYTPTEAAELMGLSRQSFYRLLEPLRERLIRQGLEVAILKKEGVQE